MQANARTQDPQLDVLECIRTFIKERHYSPTLVEICRILGFRSKGTVVKHLKTLRDQGSLTWQPGCERTIVITDRAYIALEVFGAFLNSKGRSAESRRDRRYLMRNVLRRPEVLAAIDALLRSRGLTMMDAVALHAAHIKGTLQAVRFTRDGKPVMIHLPASYAALRDYWRLTGWL